MEALRGTTEHAQRIGGQEGCDVAHQTRCHARQVHRRSRNTPGTQARPGFVQASRGCTFHTRSGNEKAPLQQTVTSPRQHREPTDKLTSPAVAKVQTTDKALHSKELHAQAENSHGDQEEQYVHEHGAVRQSLVEADPIGLQRYIHLDKHAILRLSCRCRGRPARASTTGGAGARHSGRCRETVGAARLRTERASPSGAGSRQQRLQQRSIIKALLAYSKREVWSALGHRSGDLGSNQRWCEKDEQKSARH
mmetsp:Transcript_13800/g.48741  ORF Transcript_13800/g.48741 Transcript_13800/m.48741 type:complete len:251 (+) Transcript_13800:759-1511(+)